MTRNLRKLSLRRVERTACASADYVEMRQRKWHLLTWKPNEQTMLFSARLTITITRKLWQWLEQLQSHWTYCKNKLIWSVSRDTASTLSAPLVSPSSIRLLCVVHLDIHSSLHLSIAVHHLDLFVLVCLSYSLDARLSVLIHYPHDSTHQHNLIPLSVIANFAPPHLFSSSFPHLYIFYLSTLCRPPPSPLL